MDYLVIDPKTKTVFEYTFIGEQIILEGKNIKGTYRVPQEVYKEFEPFTEEQIPISIGWPERLGEILLQGVKVKRIISINFEDEGDTKKCEAPSKSNKSTKRGKKSTNKSKTKEEDVTPAECLYGIEELSEALQMEPRKLRAILRKKYKKPEKGWKWDKDEFAKIVGELKECK